MIPVNIEISILYQMQNVCPNYHQVENYVRVPRKDVSYWIGEKNLLYVKKDLVRMIPKGYSMDLIPSGGKFFIIG